jgi:hypothetical protein
MRRGDEDNFAQHSGVQAPTDSTKDSKQKKLTEKDRLGVESQILPQKVALFILNTKRKGICDAWFEERTLVGFDDSPG